MRVRPGPTASEHQCPGPGRRLRATVVDNAKAPLGYSPKDNTLNLSPERANDSRVGKPGFNGQALYAAAQAELIRSGTAPAAVSGAAYLAGRAAGVEAPRSVQPHSARARAARGPGSAAASPQVDARVDGPGRRARHACRGSRDGFGMGPSPTAHVRPAAFIPPPVGSHHAGSEARALMSGFLVPVLVRSPLFTEGPAAGRPDGTTNEGTTRRIVERETGTDEGPNDHDPPSAVVVTRHRGSRLSVPVTAAHRGEPGLSSMFVLPPAGGLGTLVRVHCVRSGNGRSAPGFAHSGRILPWAGQRRGAADDENRDCPEFVIGGDTGEPGAGIRRGRSARSAPRWCAAGPKAMGARSTTGRRKKRDMKNMRSTTNNTERTKGTSTKSTKGGRARLRRTSSTGHPSLAIHSVLRDDRNGRDVQRDYLSATAQAT